MACGVHQDQRTQHARLLVRQGSNRLQQRQFDHANRVGIQLSGVMAFERIDVDVADDALDFGLDPAVAVISFLPGFAGLVASSQSPRETSTSRSRIMPALWLAATFFGWRAWLNTCAMVAILPLGITVICWPGTACPLAMRPQKIRRPCDVSLLEENFSTHCTGKANG